MLLSTAQVSVNRSMPVAAAQKGGPSGSAYVTFYRPEDALRCIEAVDGSVWDGEHQYLQPVASLPAQHSTAMHTRTARLLSTAYMLACPVLA
jgi:RNA recognition motif-containing protein